MKKLKAELIESVAGIFAFDDECNVIDVSFFPKNVEIISEAVVKLQRGDLIQDVTRLLDRLIKKGYSAFVFENDVLARAVREKLNIAVSIENRVRQETIFEER